MLFEHGRFLVLQFTIAPQPASPTLIEINRGVPLRR